MGFNETVLICDEVDPVLNKVLQENGLKVSYEPQITPDQLKEKISNYDIIIVRGRTKLTKELIDYLSFSDECTKKYENAFSTIALRELTLSDNFQIIVDHLPADKKYDSYRHFLKAHIELDTSNHGPLMSEALEEIKDLDGSIETMIEFYTLRKKVYDACLRETPLF
jgi:hypothetical protein